MVGPSDVALMRTGGASWIDVLRCAGFSLLSVFYYCTGGSFVIYPHVTWWGSALI